MIKKKLYRPPKVRPKKSNDWRSVFLWQNTVMSLKRKLSKHT